MIQMPLVLCPPPKLSEKGSIDQLSVEEKAFEPGRLPEVRPEASDDPDGGLDRGGHEL